MTPEMREDAPMLCTCCPMLYLLQLPVRISAAPAATAAAFAAASRDCAFWAPLRPNMIAGVFAS
jgi:hypothetical protein